MSSTKEVTPQSHLTVTCLGSSTTAAKGTYKWVKELEKRPQNKQYHFVNLGVGGDLSYNALARLPRVVATHPDKVIIIIGSNDILSMVFKNVRYFFTGWKHLPHEPSPKWFRENLKDIVSQLKKETLATIALVSLAEVGEAPNSSNPIQQQLNTLYKEFSQIVKEVAQKEKVNYIPLYEEFHKQITADPGRAFTNFSFLAFYRDYIFREFILRRSFDEIAQMNGWKFHIDGVHLNTRGGLILTDLVQEFLNK